MKLGKKNLEELKVLGEKLFEHLPPRDLAAVLFPPAMGLDLLSGMMSDKPMDDVGFDPDYPEAPLLEAVLDVAGWLSVNYFTTTVQNAEAIPAEGPVIIVGNHSAGLMPFDALFAWREIRERVSPSFIMHPLVHDFAYKAPRIARSAKRLGILRAGRENAKEALKAGRAVLVYPGGDEDAFRTYKERNRIILAGRKGFVRLAMETGAPIVPLVSVGLHESFIVLSKGRSIGRKLGIKKWFRTEIFPLSISFPWGLGPAFAPFLPLPTSVDMKFLSPIAVSGSPNDEATVDEIYLLVESAMQAAMDELVARRVPFFGQ